MALMRGRCEGVSALEGVVGRWSQYRHRGGSAPAITLQLSSAALTVDAGLTTGTLRLTFNKPLAAGNDLSLGCSPSGAFGDFSLNGGDSWLAGVTFVDLPVTQEGDTPSAPEVLTGLTNLSEVFFAQAGGGACQDVTDFPCPQSL